MVVVPFKRGKNEEITGHLFHGFAFDISDKLCEPIWIKTPSGGFLHSIVAETPGWHQTPVEIKASSKSLIVTLWFSSFKLVASPGNSLISGAGLSLSGGSLLYISIN